MRIGIDIDGTLRDFASQLIKTHKKYSCDCKFHKEQMNNYNIGKWFDCGDDIYKLAFEAWAEEIFTQAPILEDGYNDFVKENIEGNEFYLVTSQAKYDLNKYTLEWIKKYSLNHHAILMSNNGYFCRNICDVLIDDYIENLKRFDGITICYDQPWNQDWKGWRVSNLKEVSEIIKSLNIHKIINNEFKNTGNIDWPALAQLLKTIKEKYFKEDVTLKSLKNMTDIMLKEAK